MRRIAHLFGLMSLLLALISSDFLAVEQAASSGAMPLSSAEAFDPTDWILTVPATSPPARMFHAMAYDSARGRVVLFGGFRVSDYFADTWEWDGSAWARQTPATSPPGPHFPRHGLRQRAWARGDVRGVR